MRLSTANAKAQRFGYVITRCYMRVGEVQCRYVVRQIGQYDKVYPQKNLQDCMVMIKHLHTNRVHKMLDSITGVMETARKMFEHFGQDFAQIEDAFVGLLVEARKDLNP